MLRPLSYSRWSELPLKIDESMTFDEYLLWNGGHSISSGFSRALRILEPKSYLTVIDWKVGGNRPFVASWAPHRGDLAPLVLSEQGIGYLGVDGWLYIWE